MLDKILTIIIVLGMCGGMILAVSEGDLSEFFWICIAFMWFSRANSKK